MKKTTKSVIIVTFLFLQYFCIQTTKVVVAQSESQRFASLEKDSPGHGDIFEVAPIGDGAWVLLTLAMAYGFHTIQNQKKRFK